MVTTKQVIFIFSDRFIILIPLHVFSNRIQIDGVGKMQISETKTILELNNNKPLFTWGPDMN